jgi:hypothetical protein
LRGLIPRRTTFKFEYLLEFEPEFENVLGYELGVHMGSIHEKNQTPKISCFCTFKEIVGGAHVVTTGMTSCGLQQYRAMSYDRTDQWVTEGQTNGL